MSHLAETVARETDSAELRQADARGVSEITILPDGRLYVLGLSEAVLELLEAAGPWDGLSSRRPRRRPAERGETTKEAST